MSVETLGRLLSIEEFERLPEDDEYRDELVRGRLVREPLPGIEHGLLTAELACRLYSHVEERALGIVLIGAGFVLAEDPPTVRGPDVSFLSAANVPAEGVPTGYLRRAPDLAVEVVSPSNTVTEIQEKVLDYLDAECRMLWVVDPRNRSVMVYRSRDDIRIRTMGDILGGSDVLRGFRLALAELFEPLRA